MSVSCVALLSGGLDSMLAIRILQEQGIHIEALNFQTMFTCCRDDAGQAARDLGVRLTVLSAEDDYLDVVRRPQFGYGRGANPCVDCRIYMFERARKFMNQVGAKFIISGEVIGQRPMSQKRNDLDIIARQAELQDLLLRPLCAQLQHPTLPERAGWVDRSRLFGFTGRSRKGLIALARQFGFKNIPAPSTGCALTEQLFSNKVYDLIRLDPESQSWDFELLRYGRHYRLDATCKVIVGRSAEDNAGIELLHERAPAGRSALLLPHCFPWPATLLIGRVTESTLDAAGAMLLRHTRENGSGEMTVRVVRDGISSIRPIQNNDAAQAIEPTTARRQPKPADDLRS